MKHEDHADAEPRRRQNVRPQRGRVHQFAESPRSAKTRTHNPQPGGCADFSLTLAASQMRAVQSHDAVTMREPSGLKAAENTSLAWPLRNAISEHIPTVELIPFRSSSVCLRK